MVRFAPWSIALSFEAMDWCSRENLNHKNLQVFTMTYLGIPHIFGDWNPMFFEYELGWESHPTTWDLP